MRIRTDGKYAHRKDEIDAAAELWDCNRTQAVLRSCEFSRHMMSNLEEALNYPDMTEELAEVLSTPYVRLHYRIETDLDIE